MTEKNRPDHITCIKHTQEDFKRTAWCGRAISAFEFSFASIDHAAYNAKSQGYLVACPQCCKTVVKMLESKVSSQCSTCQQEYIPTGDSPICNDCAADALLQQFKDQQ